MIPPSNKERSRFVIVFLSLLMLTDSLTRLQVYLLPFLFHSLPKQNIIFLLIIPSLFLITSLLSLIYFLMWFRRAYNNLHLFGSPNLSLKEGWAVGAWFVPLINVVWPYLIMREIWRETQSMFRSPGENFSVRKFSIGNWWWGLNMLSLVISLIQHFLGVDRKTSSLGTRLFFDGSSVILLIIESFLLISMVRQISIWDEEMNSRFHHQMALSYQGKADTEQASPNNS